MLKLLSEKHHAPRLEDEGRWEERPFFVMSLAPGTTLGALRKEQGGQLALLEAAPLMDAVARAVAAVHAKEVVHRDLKPANVHAEKWVGAWWATIVDFGLAKLPKDDTLTAEAQALGSNAYQAPEARDDAHAVKPATDVFSLAVTFVELLTGQSAFGDDGQRWWSVARDKVHEATLRAWLSAQRPGAPAAIWTCLRKALRLSSSQRYADAEALAEALADAWARSPIVVSLDDQGFTRSLQEAIDLAPRRAEIVVEAGRYVESLRVRNDARVRAAQAGTVEVAPDGGRALVVEAGASSWTGLLLRGLDVNGGEPTFVECTVLAQEAVVVMGEEARPVFRQCVLTGGCAPSAWPIAPRPCCMG